MKTITEEFARENRGKKFTVTYESGTVMKNIKFFVSTSGVICYAPSNMKSRGYEFCNNNIKSIEEVKTKEYSDIANAKRILKKIHPNVWPELAEQMKKVIETGETTQDFEWHFKGKLKFKNVTKKLTTREKDELKDAFDNKKDWVWHRSTYHHSGRDLSISVENKADGALRAYFSSEYMGCGNGDYWLLLNPTTAIFYETD